MTIRSLARLAPLVALALVVACDRPSVPYDGPFAREVRRAMARLERSTGKQFLAPPVLSERSRDEVRAYLERSLDMQMSPEQLAAVESVYKRFGLLPDTLDLRATYLDLLTEQVVGYYDPLTDTLYYVRDADPELREPTIVHELVHALQDQHFPLDSIERIDGSDRRTAAHAVAEGQAVWESLVVTFGTANPANVIPGGWDAVRQMIRDDHETMPKLASAPMLLRETLLFPYLTGAEHIRQFKARRPGAWPFDSLPLSTEQLLNAERFFDSFDAPTSVALPQLTSGTSIYEDALGQFEVRLLIYQLGRDLGLASRASAGWDGDRFTLVRVAGGEALVWASVWDTVIDAAEFVDALETVLPSRYAGLTRVPSDADRRRFRGGGRQVEVRAVTVDGRPVVILTDAPAGTSMNLLDPARIRLSP